MSTDEVRTGLRQLIENDRDVTPAVVGVAIKVSERTVRRFLYEDHDVQDVIFNALRGFLISKVQASERKIANG